MQNTTIIGHRGARGHLIENTLPSIEKALALGAQAIEIDVYKIADGSLVVFHDDTVDRLTAASGPIEAYSIQSLDTLTLEGGYKIPTLAQVLELIDGRVVLNIELKGATTAKAVYQLLQYTVGNSNWKWEDFLISSFRWEELELIRTLDAQIPIGILTENDLRAALAKAKELQAVAVHPYYKLLDKEKTQQLQEKGFKVYPWTVNDTADIELMKSFGVDGIITDYPDRIH